MKLLKPFFKKKLNSEQILEKWIREKNPFFKSEIKKFYEENDVWVLESLNDFYNCKVAWENLTLFQSDSRKGDGIGKSVDIAEGFAIWCFVRHFKPQSIAEIGTRYGVSARLWKEALKKYVPEHRLTLFDLEDVRRYIDDSEAKLIVGDAFKLFPDFLNNHPVDLLILDAHPYELTRWALEEGFKRGIKNFAFHDVGKKHRRGPYKPQYYTLPEIVKLKHSLDWGTYGTWERHLQADFFDKALATKDYVQNEFSTSQVFDSLFGYSFSRLK